MNQRIRRTVCAVLLLILAIGPVLPCVPLSASAPADHCTPMRAAAAEHDCCPPADVMDCCAAPDTETPSVPAQSQSQNPRGDAGTSPAHGHDASTILSVARPGLSTILRGAPPHGYRNTDLATLHGVFLI